MVKNITTSAQNNTYLNLKKGIASDDIHYIYVTSSTNNTIISLVDSSGNVLAWKSCGMYFPGKQRSSEVASLETGRNLAALLSLMGVKNLCIFFRGVGKWHAAAVEDIVNDPECSFNILMFKDITAIPFNGCRKWKSKLKNKKRRNMNKKR